MKQILDKIKIRDKTVTAACRTPEGVEWTSLKIKPDGNEPVAQDSLPLVLPSELTEEELATTELPEISEHIKGEVTVALRSSELLMRTMEFPTSDPAEIADMVEFQVDKVSPFPIDQLAISHEILSRSDESAQVLMAAAKHECIDMIGDAFESKDVRIHSIDVRILGWLQLLRDGGHLNGTGCEVLVLVDGIDFVLTIMNEGLPIVFRSLHAHLDDMTVVDELVYEISYTLTTLDAEHELPPPSVIHFWSNHDLPAPLRTKLADKCGLKVLYHDLGFLPPLSEGILARTLSAEHRIELIPREWIEHQKRQKLKKQFSIIAGSVAAVWLLALLIMLSVFKARDIQLNSIQKDADDIAPAAQQAAKNQQKLKKLKMNSDRSDSALECLREVTQLLPAGDIEFASFNYKKGKGVTLRGSAGTDDTVYDFFEALADSELFETLKDQSVNTKTVKGGARRAIFSLSLEMPSEEDEQ